MVLIEAVKNGHEDVLSLLLDRGADINMALLVAAMEGYWDVIRLLDRGADINIEIDDTTVLIVGYGVAVTGSRRGC